MYFNMTVYDITTPLRTLIDTPMIGPNMMQDTNSVMDNLYF